MKKIILDDEDRETPVSTKIAPKAVSKAPNSLGILYWETLYMHMHGGLSRRKR